MRVKIFVDFWNLQLSWNEYHERSGVKEPIRIPWEKALPQVLLSRIGKEAKYTGTHVYASVNPKSPNDRGLKSFLQSMELFPGYKVLVRERTTVKNVKCNNEACRKYINECPYCHNPISRTVEKGVDTLIAIELFHFALENVYDKAILISNDADFVPAIEYIQRKGKNIIHAGFKTQGMTVKRACWDHIDLEDIMSDLLPPPPPAP